MGTALVKARGYGQGADGVSAGHLPKLISEVKTEGLQFSTSARPWLNKQEGGGREGKDKSCRARG